VKIFTLILAIAAQVDLGIVMTLAHPGSGIVVDQQGNVYFTHTGRGVGRIDTEGKLTYVHADTGGHWMALDLEGKFSAAPDNRLFRRVTPAGTRPALLYASGGAPFVVSRDGNVYYGSGFPGGDDTTPGGFTLTRMSPDGTKALFAPGLKTTLEQLGEAVTGLAAGRDGTLFVACPSSVLKVGLDGTVTTFVNPVVVTDCDFASTEPRSRFFHSPYLRGLDVTDEGTVYAAVTGCRCVVKITLGDKVETILKAEQPWAPTGVAVQSSNLFVLEYSNIDEHQDWTPRVRRLSSDGSIKVLATVAPDNSLSPRAEPFTGTKAGDEREVCGMKLCWCPAGRFLMGSPPDEADHRPDEAQVEVTLAKGFWMGKYEVTQGQWRRVVGEFPAERTVTAGDGDDYPVYWVNFTDAEAFCRKLTALTHSSGDLPAEWEFRIPTEAQWEYACRAGTTTATSFGNALTRMQANFAGKPYGIPDGPDAGPALKRATRVGSYSANAWGLHDMHGNEFEWCRDWYHESLPGGVNPDMYSVQGTPNRDGTYSRVRRGGAWNDDGRFCRSALRLRYEPLRGSDHIGFRFVAERL
jgi:formylglycine-generating enzyme